MMSKTKKKRYSSSDKYLFITGSHARHCGSVRSQSMNLEASMQSPSCCLMATFEASVPPNAFDSLTCEGIFMMEVRKMLICLLLIVGVSAVLQYKNLQKAFIRIFTYISYFVNTCLFSFYIIIYITNYWY